MVANLKKTNNKQKEVRKTKNHKSKCKMYSMYIYIMKKIILFYDNQILQSD